MYSFIRVVMVVCFLLLPALAGASSPVTVNVPLGSVYYDYIEKLDGMGYLKSMPSGAKPYSRLNMARWTKEAAEKAKEKPAPPYLADYLRELQEDFAPEIAALEGRGAPESLKVRESVVKFNYLNSGTTYGYPGSIAAGWQPLNQNNDGRRYDRGSNFFFSVEASGRIGRETAVAFTPSFSYGQDGKARIDALYFKTRVGVFGVEAGKQAIFWGYGATGSFILGNNAAPLTMLKFNLLEPHEFSGFLRFLGKADFTLLYSRLEGNRRETAAIGNAQDFNHPGLLGLRVDITPSRSFTFGASRASMLGGSRHGLDRSDWKDWLVGKNATIDALDRWNDVAGLDFRFRLPGLQIYGDYYGEDEANYFPAHIAKRIGVYFPRLSKNGEWDLRAEYAVSGGRWYDHWAFQNGWVYRGNILGDVMGPDAQKYYLSLRRHLNKTETVSLNAARAKMGRSLPLPLQNSEILLTYGRRLNDRCYLDAAAGFAKIDNAGYATKDKDCYFVNIRLRWLY